MNPQTLVGLARKFSIQIIGANCGNGFEGMEVFLPQFAAAKPGHFVMMKLNAGIPVHKSGKDTYPQATPDNVIAYTKQAFDAGADLIGLCCGGTPELIRTMVDSAKLWR
jgi:5-methyltetrahydrofolate--homocysteine methyltransferase